MGGGHSGSRKSLFALDIKSLIVTHKRTGSFYVFEREPFVFLNSGHLIRYEQHPIMHTQKRLVEEVAFNLTLLAMLRWKDYTIEPTKRRRKKKHIFVRVKTVIDF